MAEDSEQAKHDRHETALREMSPYEILLMFDMEVFMLTHLLVKIWKARHSEQNGDDTL